MSRKTTSPAVASLTLEIGPRGPRLHLLPAGEFRSRDSRPVECKAWRLNAQLAARIVADAKQRRVPFVIDYEHQTLHTERNGQPAPAAGWFTQLEWCEPGDGEPGGLYAIDVDWMARAAALIDAREYRFQSPVFSYDPVTGDVTGIAHAAITNNPGLDLLSEVALTAALSLFPPTNPPTSENTVDKVALCKLLKLPETATEAEIQAALTKLSADAASSQQLTAQVASLTAQVGQPTTTTTTTTPDPEKFVPIGAVKEMQLQLAALTSQVVGGEVDKLVKDALDKGALTPALEGWARDLGKQNLAALKTYLTDAPCIAALSGQQSANRPNVDAGTGLDADTLAVCRMMGSDPADVKKNLGA